MSKILGLNVSLYISSLAQKAKSIQIHPPYTRLPSPDSVRTGENADQRETDMLKIWKKLENKKDDIYVCYGA